MARKVRFKCLECGTVHVFVEKGDGEYEIEIEKADDKQKPRKKGGGDLFDWLLGKESGDDE
jgi:hypothetical protein